ncbi:alpha/beta hydrolase [Candidatus Pantoea soli]|uniref:Alpha/beta hydrolase n=1 Tax=Candidatus Pantoea soli TaxID=3098669 RepID=A0A518XJH9_9GAMM|nr:alpha/beta hydrolase [Pantoea soli]QDY44338.1 alpha/beta hydrolase [Pantoea soli]
MKSCKLHSLIFLALAGISVGGYASASSPGNDTAPAAPVKNIILVHGLFADASSWSGVIPVLQARGLKVTAVQNPTTSLQDDVAAVRRAIALQKGPVILVAHSYGGMVISEAGNDPKVRGLVYVAARAPAAGEDYTALTRKFTPAPASAGIKWTGDYGQLTEDAFVHDFAGDLPLKQAQVLYAVQQPMGRAVTLGRTTEAAWQHKPVYYAVSTQDRTISPDLERFMAKRMKAYTIELKASHLSLISQPEAVAGLILRATHADEK